MSTKDFTKASKTILLMLFLLMGIHTSWAQKHDFANWNRYAQQNKEL